MWRRLLLCLVLAAGSVAFAGNMAGAQDAVRDRLAPSIETTPEPQASIASSIPAFGEFKKGLLDLGLNFQLNYTAEVLGNPAGGVKRRATSTPSSD
jgi:porin